MAPVPNGGRRLVGRTVPEGSLRPQHRSADLAAPLSGLTQIRFGEPRPGANTSRDRQITYNGP